jgi:hypothetical protein
MGVGEGERPDMIAVQEGGGTRIVISATGLSPTGRTKLSWDLR